MPSDEPFDPDHYAWTDEPAAPREPGPELRGPQALLDDRTRTEIESEILFQQTKVELARLTPRLERPFLRTLFAFLVVLGAWGLAPAEWVLLAVVVHEAGHALAAWWLGHRDAHAFALPWPMRPRADLPAWRQGAVLLAGPLPGLLLATWLPAPAAMAFATVNVLMFLPVFALDGGPFLEVLPTFRWPWMMVFVRAIVAAGYIAVASFGMLGERLAPVLTFAAGGVLASMPHAYFAARSRRMLAALAPGLPPTLERLTDAQIRKLFELVRVVLPDTHDPRPVARFLRDLHAQASPRTATGLPAILLALAAIAGLASGLAVIFP